MKLVVIALALPLLVQALPALNGPKTNHKNTTVLLGRDTSMGDKELFASCPGGSGTDGIPRADRCTMINIKNNPNKIIYKNLGSPQLNCAGGTTPVTVTLGGSTSVSTTTTVDTNIGINFEGISIGGGISTSDTKTTETSKSISYQVPPGKQAVYLAGITFRSQTGNVQVNYGKRVKDHYIWFTGAKVTKLIPDGSPPRYQVHESKCGTDPNNLSGLNK